ncbi:AraC-like DNA-binding protein [Kutzneria viridogrisea]|uniref:AraC-like DNA-binding protein n=1 Tax=Kutzneria viridogrisea TaxID=47990 RepID=A0ABR6BN35_9PSEU|nr:AraC-like DNA-binding protein [Kutzneria viridogrisea]
MVDHLIPAPYVGAITRGAVHGGLELGPLLRRAGVPADPESGLSAAQVSELVLELRRVTGDEFLGLLPARGAPGAFGRMCVQALREQDLGRALHRAFARSEVFPTRAVQCVSGDHVTSVSIRAGAVPDPGNFVAGIVLLVWHRTACWAVDRYIPLRRITFPGEAPPGSGALFGCPVTTGPEASAQFPAHYLRCPVRRGGTDLRAFLHRAPLVFLDRPDLGGAISARVRHALARGLRRGVPSLEQVATRLAMSVATLRRRLSEDGVSFRALREEVLREEAVASLREGREPVHELARRLGFSESSAFRRAFKRWTGLSPGQAQTLAGASSSLSTLGISLPRSEAPLVSGTNHSATAPTTQAPIM